MEYPMSNCLVGYWKLVIDYWIFKNLGGIIMPNKPIDLSIEFCGKTFKNPFLLSSSPVSNSAEMVARSFDAGWSGVVFKTLNY